MGIALAAAIACGLDPHQSRIHRVLDVATQDAVLDQHILLAGVAFVVHIERATAVGHRPIVKHRHALGCHTLADASAEGTRAFSIEVTFQTVAHRLVQEHARPTRTEDHRHLTGRRRACIQVGQRRMHGFVHIGLDHRIVEIGQTKTTTAATAAGLTAAALLGNHRHRQADQRAHIGGQRAVGACDQHPGVFGGGASHHRHHARVLGSGEFFDLLQQAHLGRTVQGGHRVQRGVERAAG